MHVVWLELVIHPTAMLVFQERPADGSLDRVASGPRRFFGPREWAAVAGVGGLATLLVEQGFARSVALDVDHGRAMALSVLLLGVVASVAVLTRLRTTASRVAVALVATTTVALIQVPRTAAILSLRPLHRDDWALVAVAAAATGLATWGSGLGAFPRNDPRSESPRAPTAS